MPHLNEPDAVLARSQRLHDAVDAVTRKPEDHLDAPFGEDIDEHVGCRLGHVSSARYRAGRPDSELGASRCAPSSTPTPSRSTSSPPSHPATLPSRRAPTSIMKMVVVGASS